VSEREMEVVVAAVLVCARMEPLRYV
jgi:hypothetical protein